MFQDSAHLTANRPVSLLSGATAGEYGEGYGTLSYANSQEKI